MAIVQNKSSAVTEASTRDTAAPANADLTPPQDNRIESHSLAPTDSKSARHTLIAEAAYRRAEQRGFAAGDDWQDWFAAEREVDALLDPDL